MPTPANGFPQLFGKYRLQRKLARGGMAELFLATEGETQRALVIKRVLPHFTEDTEFLKMFLNEARIAAQLSHPGIVRVFDLGKEAEHLYIAMEFVDGFDLETLTKLSGGKLPPAIAARIGAEVCDALYYANRMSDLEGKPLNIVHRDVTPGNVMVTRRGGVKLVDFGVAKAAAQLERTRPGVVKGKFRYMSPEQISFKELDGRSDLFSLGTMLYEVTTGEKPFERKQIVDIIRALTEWNPPPPTEVVKGYPKAISAAIMQALAKDRDKRYRHAREMQQALEQALAKTPTARAELAAFITDLAKKHPNELAPIAPEFELAEDLVVPTDPMRPNPMAQDTARMTGVKPGGAGAGVGELRTEAIPGKEIKRMIAEADRRAASRGAPVVNKPPDKPPDKPLPRQSSRLPFHVGPPLDGEATKLGLDDEDGEEETTTTTEPAGQRPKPATAPARPSAQPRISQREAPKPPPPTAFDEDQDDDDAAFDDGPSTQRVHPPEGRAPTARRSGRSQPGLQAAGLGDDGDVELPTVSTSKNVSRPQRRRAPDPEEPSVVSELSTGAARRSSNRRFVIAILAVAVAALIALGWIFTAGKRAATDIPEQLRDGVDLGKQPMVPEKVPEKVHQRAPAKDPGDPPVDPTPPKPDPGAKTDHEAAAWLSVTGPQGTRVAIGDRPLQAVPFTLNEGDIAPGRHKCTFVPPRGKRRVPCKREVVLEAGTPVSFVVK